MAVVTSCPDRESLRGLMVGELAEPESEYLAQHLESCPACAAVVATIRAEDTLVGAARERLTPAERSELSAIYAIAGRLRGIGPPSETAVEDEVAPTLPQLAAAPEASAGESYPFLAPPQGPDEIGRLGPYRVVSVLGSGGMGVVFRAEDTGLKRWVALKVMKPALADGPSARERFLREARAAAAFNHENIVTIYQVGEDRGVPFLAMQLLQGRSLEEWMQKSGPMDIATTLRLGRQIANGLAAAHERGLIHRDIKPANLWLEKMPGGLGTSVRHRVKILDFGLVRPTQDDVRITGRGDVIGTPAYMAPEQGCGGTVDHRCDLFSLGCVLYRALTGSPPFPSENAVEVLIEVATKAPIPVRNRNPAVPPMLAELVMQLLEKKPAERPGTACEVADRLQAIERQPKAPAAPEAAGNGRSEPLDRAPVRSRSRRTVSVAVALMAILPLGYMFGGQVIRVATNKGQVVMRVNDPALDVTVEEGGATIKDRMGQRTITLAAGEHDLTVTVKDAAGEGFFFTKRFTLSRGGKEIIDVNLEPNKVKIPPPPPQAPTVSPFDALAREQIPTDELICAGGGDPAKAPSQLVAILGDSRLHHAAGVNALAFSPVNGLMVSVGPDRTIRFWDVTTGRPARPPFFGNTAFSVALSPDASRVAVANTNGEVRLLDAETGLEVHVISGHTGFVNSVAFDPSGTRLLSAGQDKIARIWDATTGKEIKSIPPQSAPLLGAAFSRDGKWVLTAAADGNWYHPGACKGITVWDVETGQEALKLEDGDKAGWCVAVSPTGNHFAGGNADGTLYVWDARTGRKVQSIEAHKQPHKEGIKAVAFCPDGGRVATGGSEDGTAAVWEVSTGKLVARTLQHNLGRINGVAFSPDGAILGTTEPDGPVRLWNSATGQPLHPSWGTSGVITGVAVSSNGQMIAAASEDQSVRVWDIGGAAPVLRWQKTTLGSGARAVAISKAGDRVAAATDDGAFVVWDSTHGDEVARGQSTLGHIDCVLFSPDGRRLFTIGCGNGDGHVEFWDAKSGANLRGTLAFPRNELYMMAAISPDGNVLAVISGTKNIQLRNARSGVLIRTIEGSERLWSIAFSPDGRHLAAGTDDYHTVIWDATTGKKTFDDGADGHETGHKAEVMSVAYSPAGRLVTAGRDGRILLWDPATGETLSAIQLFPSGKSGAPFASWERIAVSPDGRHVVTGNGKGTIYVLRLSGPQK